MTHPSFLALDAHGVSADAAISAHVASCDQCAAHLVRLREVAPLPMQVIRARSKPSHLLRYVISGGAMAAALVLILSWAPSAEVMTAKGGVPAVQLWVKRDATVRPWAGEAVKPGEAVRFEISPAGFSHVSVVELMPSPHVIYEVVMSGSGPTLTPAWALDARGEREELAVMLTRAPIRVPDGALRCEQNNDEWCARFSLNKKAETP